MSQSANNHNKTRKWRRTWNFSCYFVVHVIRVKLSICRCSWCVKSYLKLSPHFPVEKRRIILSTRRDIDYDNVRATYKTKDDDDDMVCPIYVASRSDCDPHQQWESDIGSVSSIVDRWWYQNISRGRYRSMERIKFTCWACCWKGRNCCCCGAGWNWRIWRNGCCCCWKKGCCCCWNWAPTIKFPNKSQAPVRTTATCITCYVTPRNKKKTNDNQGTRMRNERESFLSTTI